MRIEGRLIAPGFDQDEMAGAAELLEEIDRDEARLPCCCLAVRLKRLVACGTPVGVTST
jgi:hypothetical protein